MRVLFLFAGLFMFAGCTKTNSPEVDRSLSTSTENSSKISVIKRANTLNTSETDLRNFFLSYDTNILKSLKNGIDPLPDNLNNSSSSEIQYMVSKNIELMGILASIRPSVYYEMNPEDEMIAYAGLIEMVIQLEGGSVSYGVSKPIPWACIRGVLEGLLAGAGVIEGFQTLISEGATWSTVRSFLWRTFKRYVGWFAVAGAIYDIYTECF